MAWFAPDGRRSENLQYIWHPGGGAASPAPFAGKRLKDAAVLGLRSVLKF
jgi:hypothetical protein